MAIEKEVYEEILGKAVADAQERFPQRFLRYDYDKKKGWTELGTVTINEFIDNVHKNFEDNHFLEGDSVISKEAREASFASNRALQIMYGVAASEDIKSNINVFFDDKKNDAWFEKKGITGEEKTALREELTRAVDEQILGADKSKSNQRLVSSIQRIYKDYPDVKKRDNFLNDCFSYIDWLNKEIVQCEKTAREVSEANFEGTPTRKGVNRMTASMLNNAVFDYVQDIAESTNFTFSYDKHKGVNPHDFLKHYHADPEGLSKLTKEEKDWADSQLNSLMYDAQAKYGHDNKLTFDEFYADGAPLISVAHAKQVINGEKEFNTVSSKIVASMLDGDEVTCRANNSVNYMHVNPMIKDITVETWWDRFIEKLAELFHLSTDKKWVAEKRESFEKAKVEEVDTTRQRVSFEEIKESSPFDKVTAPSKNQKTKENKNPEL